ncbi:hypothetical protein AB0K02_05260 [Streptomyces sp. NPDC049597]|uniref:hypothetical protein n=1 Tax=Streptomyces sp. NPDC049597 TaxID=3155276 RepID=UPI0034188681
MLDTSELITVGERFADRLRAAPQSRLQRGAAAEGLALARELSVRAQRLEDPSGEPMLMPDEGVFAVADQLVVAVRDLAEVLRDTPEGPEQVDAAVVLVQEAAARSGL